MDASSNTIGNILPQNVALLALDFDGVLTDNKVYIGQDGQEWVKCSRGDGMGISELKKMGILVVVFSTEKNPVVSARCEKLQIECIQSCEDKSAVLKGYLEDKKIDSTDVVFVGNDINDIECLELVGCGIVVSDAHEEALKAADATLSRAGGHEAVRELCDCIIKHRAL